MNIYDLEKPYIKYNEDVLTGRIVACKAIILACQRMKDWFDRDDIYFDYEDVDKKIRFVSKMKHFLGEHANKPFNLLAWQQWVFANIYGWKYVDSNYRVTQNVLLFISRKNGKSSLASAIGLVALAADNEPAAEIDIVANSTAQAAITFNMCKNYAESLDPNSSLFERYKACVKMPSTKSQINVLCSDTAGLDGYNASTFIIDEFHMAKNWELYEVLKSSQGARTQPLAITITTAGVLLQGYPLYEMRITCLEILKGIKKDDSQFSAIYEIDDEDDYTDESCWTKCSPSLGQTVKYNYLRGRVTTAQNEPSREFLVKTKDFNRFCQSSDVWIPDSYIESSMQHVDTKQLNGCESYAGIDLSAVSDLTSFSVMFPPNEERSYYPDKYIFKTYCYLPKETVDNSPNSDVYRTFVREKEIICTPGNVVDYDIMLEDVKEVDEATSLQTVAYDQWNSTQFVINAEDEGIPMNPFSQTLGNFNRPTKFFEMLIKKGKVIIDTNSCVRWCFGNVELKQDWNENCKPVKAGNDKTKKIDPVISMLEALGSYLLSPGADISVS